MKNYPSMLPEQEMTSKFSVGVFDLYKLRNRLHPDDFKKLEAQFLKKIIIWADEIEEILARNPKNKDG